MMVALLAARSSMISSKSERVAAVDGAHAPIVQEEDVGLGQLNQPFAEGAAAVPDAQLFLQPGHPLIDGRVAAATGVLRQRAGQPRFAGAGRPGDEDAVSGLNPVAQCQAHDRAAVEAARWAGCRCPRWSPGRTSGAPA